MWYSFSAIDTAENLVTANEYQTTDESAEIVADSGDGNDQSGNINQDGEEVGDKTKTKKNKGKKNKKNGKSRK